MDYMKIALSEAHKGMKLNHGGPFGAVIVKDNKIIAKGHNMVLASKDPTAHAEIVAIRKACAKLGTHDLANSILYTSCYPCPMCFGAILWSNISKAYYGWGSAEAAKIGFNDSLFYEIINDAKQTKINDLLLRYDYDKDEFKALSDEYMERYEYIKY